MCPYSISLEICLQHPDGSPMEGLEIRNMIELFRSLVPEIAIRTTLDGWVPTQTEDDFTMLTHFVRDSLNSIM